jgi:subtilase family serine protease
MMGVAMPAVADTASPGTRLSSDARDAGPVDAATPMTAMVWIKGRDQALFDTAVAERYDRNSPYYHRWMTAQEMAGFGPAAQDLATIQASLRAQGLKIEQVSDDGAAIKVSGTAARIQTAFGTSIHTFQSAGRTFFTNLTEPKFQGAHAELVDAVTGLSNIGMRPYAMRQIDFATGQPRAGVPAAQATVNPLASFTNKCFTPETTRVQAGNGVSATYRGPEYLTAGPFAPFCGYTAQQLVAHYGLDAVHAEGWTGKGQTIVVVDAFGSPQIETDANTFSQAMGLPALTNKNFEIVFPDGQPTVDGITAGWADEVSLDVEWAHALAPDAKIVLVVAPTAADAELAFAINYAIAHKLGNVISNSFGEVELGTGPATARLYNGVFEKAAAQGIAINVATGDSGDFGLGTPLGAASIPADSPFATGIGGTSLDVPSDSGPVEAVWGIDLTILATAFPQNPPFKTGFAQGSGGGESVYLEKPAFQRALPGTGRQLPDVSAVGDPQTGAIVVVPDPLTGGSAFTVIGGTSLATPVFSAIWALADQAAGESLGQAAPLIAQMSPAAVTDILPIDAFKNNTSGSITVTDPSTSNTTTTTYGPAQLLGLDQTQPEGFVGVLAHPTSGLVELFDFGFGADSSLKTTAGWDNATGWGVPNGLPFINAAKKLAKSKFSS